MSFIIGQAVTVHPSIMAIGRYGGVHLNVDMLRMKGLKMTIDVMNESINRYLVAENPFMWTAQMMIS